MTYAYNTRGLPAVGNGLPGLPQRQAMAADGGPADSREFFRRVESRDANLVDAGQQLKFGGIYLRADYPSVESFFPTGDPILASLNRETFSTPSMTGCERVTFSPDGKRFVLKPRLTGSVRIFATGPTKSWHSAGIQGKVLVNGEDSMFWVTNEIFVVFSRGESSTDDDRCYVDTFKSTDGSNFVKVSGIILATRFVCNVCAVYEDDEVVNFAFITSTSSRGIVSISKETGEATRLLAGTSSLVVVVGFKRGGRPVPGVEEYFELLTENSTNKTLRIRRKNAKTGAEISAIVTPNGTGEVNATQDYAFSYNGKGYCGLSVSPFDKFIKLTPDGSYEIIEKPSGSPAGIITNQATDDIRGVYLDGSGNLYDVGGGDFYEHAPVLLIEGANGVGQEVPRLMGIAAGVPDGAVVDYGIVVPRIMAAGSTTSGTALAGYDKFRVQWPRGKDFGFKV